MWKNTEFILLAGSKYCELLIPYYSMPFDGIPLGRRMQMLDEWMMQKKPFISSYENNVRNTSSLGLDSLSYRLHKYFNSLPRLTFRDIDNIPYDNGIYVFFEVGEKYFGWGRIVCVGTHIMDHRLKERLKNHYIRENKDGSIFRKNIGNALLNRDDNPYLKIWSYDTSKEDKLPE